MTIEFVSAEALREKFVPSIEAAAKVTTELGSMPQPTAIILSEKDGRKYGTKLPLYLSDEHHIEATLFALREVLRDIAVSQNEVLVGVITILVCDMLEQETMEVKHGLAVLIETYAGRSGALINFVVTEKGVEWQPPRITEEGSIEGPFANLLPAPPAAEMASAEVGAN